MKKTLPSNIDLVYDEYQKVVLVKNGKRILDLHDALSFEDAKKVFEKLEETYKKAPY